MEAETGSYQVKSKSVESKNRSALNQRAFSHSVIHDFCDTGKYSPVETWKVSEADTCSAQVTSGFDKYKGSQWDSD